jgi:hypothetical protein
MKKVNHKGKCEEVHPDISHGEWTENQSHTEEELDELIDFDGSVLGNKVPLGYEMNQTMSSKKTTDAVVPATTQSGLQGRGYMYKRYWGESVEELGEMDMSDMLGAQDDDADVGEEGVPLQTDTMSKKEVVDMYQKKYGFEEDEAEDRAEATGAIDGKKKRLIEDEDILNMLEVILSKKEKDNSIHSDETIKDEMLERKARHLKKYIDKQGYDMKEVMKKYF